MELKDKLLKVKEASSTLINDVQTLPEELETLLAQKEAEAVQRETTQYQQGLADGKASMGEDSDDKIYSQLELEETVAAALEPVQSQLSNSQAEAESLRTQLENIRASHDSELAAAVATAKNDLILEIQADLQAAEESENATELEFKSKLQARIP